MEVAKPNQDGWAIIVDSSKQGNAHLKVAEILGRRDGIDPALILEAIKKIKAEVTQSRASA